MTDDELLNLDPVSRRAETVRYDVLDASLAVIDTLEVIAGQVPTVENNINRTIKRTLGPVKVDANEQALIDPIQHRLRPVWILENGSEFNLGVFLYADVNRTRHTYGLDLEATLVDQLFILDQAVEHSVSYSVGQSIREALIAQAAEAGIVSVNADASAKTLSAPVAWPPGTHRLKLMTELCDLAGFYSPFFDNNGTLRFREVPDLVLASSDHTYGEGGRVIEGTIVESDDLLETPNRYIVIDSQAGDAVITGFADVDATAPNSIANRGFVVANVHTAQGITSAAAATEMAQARASQTSETYKWAQFSATPDPRHDTFQIVTWRGERYREQSWRLPLTPGGPHAHELRRVYG